jgi:hypothetical protein
LSDPELEISSKLHFTFHHTFAPLYPLTSLFSAQFLSHPSFDFNVDDVGNGGWYQKKII